uniref:Uncharacterized protein n=1 Tax=Ackermannviridae sp. TaxID=2831612 RepID=A0A8S5VLE4_9CAUD|nr:MAG TPA: hypothetical protein [Ackermannviridae sp.]
MQSHKLHVDVLTRYTSTDIIKPSKQRTAAQRPHRRKQHDYHI